MSAVPLWLPAVAVSVAVWLAGPPPPARLAPARSRRARAVEALVVGALALVLLPRGWGAPALVLSIASLGGWSLWHRGVRARLARRRAAAMAEVCDVLAAELSAGRPTDSALAEAARSWPDLLPVVEASRLGGDVPGELRRLSVLPGADGLGVLAAAWLISARTGGGLAAATGRVADSVRRDQATGRIVAGELASARATARLVAGLPVVALLMGSGAGADPWTFLLGTPYGLGCLSAGLAVGWLGLWWIELIARQVER
ncbi:MAG: type II secretion system F family protein [Nocardioides sp.]